MTREEIQDTVRQILNMVVDLQAALKEDDIKENEKRAYIKSTDNVLSFQNFTQSIKIRNVK